MADDEKMSLAREAVTPMSLEQAGAALRAELNAHRAKVTLAAAVDTALTAKQQLARLNQQMLDVRVAMETTAKNKARAEEELAASVADLGGLRGQVLAAQADLKALNAGIADTRKAWAAEDTTRAAAQRKALVDLDREILAAQARLKAVREELAAVVAPYAKPGVISVQV
jgi:predicted  nucleic acid-binding Zn-ribbon protein